MTTKDFFTLDMRFLIIPLAGGVGLGPLTRCLAVAREAVGRGHEVVFLCQKSFADSIKKFGYKTYLAPTPQPGSITPPPFRLSDIAIARGWVDPAYLEKAVQAERTIIRAFRPDCIFTETQFSVSISAVLEGIPWVAATSWADHPDFTSPLYSSRETATGFEVGVNRILDRYHLPNINDLNELAYLRADLKIAPTIPELQPELTKVPHVHFVGYLLSPQMEQGDLPPDVRRWPKTEPVIYVYMSPGDIAPNQWIKTLVKTFANTNFRVMVALAPLTVQPRKLPTVSNIKFYKSLPGSSAIQRANLVITHGGGNTVSNSLFYGKPLMIFSHRYAERDYNGRSVERLGAGLNFRTEQFNPKDTFQNAQKLIADTTFTHQARRLGAKMRQLGGSRKTLILMEQLLP